MKGCSAVAALCWIAHAAAQPAPQPRVLLFFSLNVEADHMLFATDALRFFAEVGDRHNIRVDATSNWSELNDENLKQYKLVVWLNGGRSEERRVGKECRSRWSP